MSITAEMQSHAVVFFPFLRLSHVVRVGDVEFLPLRDENDTTPAALSTLVPAITQILKGYVDRESRPVTNCVVATVAGKGWDVKRDDLGVIRSAASLLFLSCWASNHYFRRFGSSYVNSTMFRFIGQSFTGEVPDYITLSARRRDGRSMDGGYRHGEVKFSVPNQCRPRERPTVDERLLDALNQARAVGSGLVPRLVTALQFVELANTDDDFMGEDAELVLMATAFEHLFGSSSSAYSLAKEFGDLFDRFGSIRFDAALGPGTSRRFTPEANEEMKVAGPWLHRHWIKVLYQARSLTVHADKKYPPNPTWSPFEHLVMAAHTFPLAVKLLLAQHSPPLYNLTAEDRAGCYAVDAILSIPSWYPRDPDADDEAAQMSAADMLLKARLRASNEGLDPILEATIAAIEDLDDGEAK